MNVSLLSNSLALEDITIPQQYLFWPLAMIWWIALLAIFLLVILYFYLTKEKRRKKKVRAFALRVYDSYPLPFEKPAEIWLQDVNRLLKRITKQTYPKEKGYLLEGKAWLRYLQEKCPQSQIEKYYQADSLLYQKDVYLDSSTIEEIHQSVRLWILHYA